MATYLPSRKLLARAQGGSGSRLMVQIGIAVYSFVATFILIRSLFLSVGIADSLWVGGLVYGVTDPIVAPIALLPGGDVELVGQFEVADLTALGIVLAVPFILAAKRPT